MKLADSLDEIVRGQIAEYHRTEPKRVAATAESMIEYLVNELKKQTARYSKAPGYLIPVVVDFHHEENPRVTKLIRAHFRKEGLKFWYNDATGNFVFRKRITT